MQFSPWFFSSIVIKSVLNGNASAGTLSSFIAVLNFTQMLCSPICFLLHSKKINREFVNKKVFCSIPFFKMNAF